MSLHPISDEPPAAVGAISLFGIPLDIGASELGARMGPVALRIAGLPQHLQELGYDVIDHGDLAPPTPAMIAAAGEGIDFTDPRHAEIAAWTQAAHDKAYAMLQEPAVPIFLGGDHSVAMGTVSAVSRYCRDAGKDLAIIWIDAHADFNTLATTPSGNVHGMPVSFLCGEPHLRPFLGNRPFVDVNPETFTLFGLRSIDAAERRALRDSRISCVDMGMIDEEGVSTLIKRFLEHVAGPNTHLHVSLDVDSLDPSIAPGVGTLVPGGINYREAHLIMELLHRSGLVGSLDVVELNPFLDERGRSARVLAELTASLFGRTVLDRGPVNGRP